MGHKERRVLRPIVALADRTEERPNALEGPQSDEEPQPECLLTYYGKGAAAN